MSLLTAAAVVVQYQMSSVEQSGLERLLTTSVVVPVFTGLFHLRDSFQHVLSQA